MHRDIIWRGRVSDGRRDAAVEPKTANQHDLVQAFAGVDGGLFASEKMFRRVACICNAL